MQIYYLLPIFLLSCLAFNSETGKHYISRLVVVMLVISVFTARDILRSNINKPEIKKIMFFWLPIIVFFAGYHVFRGEAFGVPRTILVSLVYIVIVPWHRMSKQAILFVILLGGCVAGGVGLYEYAILNVRRVGGIINQIPFALYVAITLLISIHVAWSSQYRYIKPLAWLCVIGSSFAIIMSEVRGIWLALLLIAAIFAVRQSQQLTLRRIATMTAIVLALLVMLSSIPDVTRRINETKQEFTRISEGNKDTSIGIRLQLWYSAIDIIKNHPLMGVGTQNYPYIMEQQYQQGMITSVALSFKNSHYHNQYLDTYVRYGVIGFIMVFVILISPNILFYNKDLNVTNLYSSISCVLIFSGLTDVPLIHTGVVYVLILYPSAIFFTSREACVTTS
ncbi:O-antigen ligase family protein [Aeromonas media]|uniref:O-antigen ligase family protein n=1 Tax=Aeromonas media TaxID=651 RepID=UPI003D06144C